MWTQYLLRKSPFYLSCPCSTETVRIAHEALVACSARIDKQTHRQNTVTLAAHARWGLIIFYVCSSCHGIASPPSIWTEDITYDVKTHSDLKGNSKPQQNGHHWRGTDSTPTSVNLLRRKQNGGCGTHLVFSGRVSRSCCLLVNPSCGFLDASTQPSQYRMTPTTFFQDFHIELSRMLLRLM